MWRAIKLLFYIALLGLIALIGYAYLGPFFGADFSPSQVEIRQPVLLGGE